MSAPSTPHRLLAACCVVLPLLVVAGGTARAAKDDVLVLENGDSLTGEIKELSRGRLRFKTPSTDSIYFDWSYVASLTSRDRYDIELRDASTFFGSLEGDAETRTLDIITAEGVTTVPVADVVYITRIKESFFGRVDGNVDLGFSYTSATRLLQYSLLANAKHRSDKWLSSVKLDSIFNDQEEVDAKHRDDLSFGLTRFLRDTRLVRGSVQAQSNADLGYDLRTLVSLGLGVSPIQTNHQLLAVTAGLSAQREHLIDSSDALNSLEILAALTYESFRYSKPKRDVSIQFSAYPSVTESDRIRVELNVRVRFEVVSNLHIGVSLLESYDSNPPSEGAENSDVALILSLGYSF